MNKDSHNPTLDTTSIKDLKPQLFCIGRLLGMDLYIDMRGKHPDKYEIAQNLLDGLLKESTDGKLT